MKRVNNIYNNIVNYSNINNVFNILIKNIITTELNPILRFIFI